MMSLCPSVDFWPTMCLSLMYVPFRDFEKQNKSNRPAWDEEKTSHIRTNQRPTVSSSDTQLFSTVIWQWRRLHNADGMATSKFLDLPTWFVPFFSVKDRFDAFSAAFEIASNRQFEFGGILRHRDADALYSIGKSIFPVWSVNRFNSMLTIADDAQSTQITRSAKFQFSFWLDRKKHDLVKLWLA